MRKKEASTNEKAEGGKWEKEKDYVSVGASLNVNIVFLPNLLSYH